MGCRKGSQEAGVPHDWALLGLPLRLEGRGARGRGICWVIGKVFLPTPGAPLSEVSMCPGALRRQSAPEFSGEHRMGRGGGRTWGRSAKREHRVGVRGGEHRVGAGEHRVGVQGGEHRVGVRGVSTG